MHPTIQAFHDAVLTKDDTGLLPLFAQDIRFLPPTYWKTWTGNRAVAAVLGHVNAIFTDFTYRRVLGDGRDWMLEFHCKVEGLDAVGVDLITLNDDGLMQEFEVVMRPYKTVGALREAMMARIAKDPGFAAFRDAMR
ncbi:nuclear transport factor 2 family protein [Pararhodobacter zhoushanensis]|uniref:nuclear transport factor 2 family protein n=1 Tax=Pararhodobacter zhoushanensis TaxID=2479545 RepID=UPI000F8C9DE9|nr:nuclear transport factor 2 family protein [Pararhodobacter zhoushanensis]